MATVAQKLQKLLEIKEAIRQAIIGKGQNVASTLPFSSYPAKIAAIQTGMDTSDATAVAGDILSGKTAYAKGQKLVGTMPSVVQATPSITVDSAGKITASATQSAGYVFAGSKSATKQLTTQAGKTVTPGASSQTAVASGRYTTGAVTVAGDANLVAENIKGGTSIFGVSGSLIKAGQTVALGYIGNAFPINVQYLTLGSSTWTNFTMSSPVTLQSVVCLRIGRLINGETVYTGTSGFFTKVGLLKYYEGDEYDVYIPNPTLSDNRVMEFQFGK